MRVSNSRLFFTALVVGVAALLLSLGVGFGFLLPSVNPTAGPNGGTVQSVPIILRQTSGLFPTVTGSAVNTTVVAEDSLLSAGDIEFVANNSTGAFAHVWFLAELSEDGSQVVIAMFNSSASTWWGEPTSPSANPFGGWVVGANESVLPGDQLTFYFNGPASGIYIFVWVAGGGGDGQLQDFHYHSDAI
jgi:hypothetical protein